MKMLNIYLRFFCIKKTVISNTDELYQVIADALETITPNDAQNCFEHCI